MPKVGKKHFPYSAKGVMEARKYAKKSGNRLTLNKGGKVKRRK